MLHIILIVCPIFLLNQSRTNIKPKIIVLKVSLNIFLDSKNLIYDIIMFKTAILYIIGI